MPTISIDAFLPEVLVHVPGCPDPVAANAVLRAAIDFCNRSLIWREMQDAEMVSADDLPYYLTGPTHGAVARVLSASFAGQGLTPVTDDVARTASPTYETSQGMPTRYTMVAFDQMQLLPAPAERGLLSVNLAFTPKASTTVLEQFLHVHWFETLVSGALRRLMIIPGQTWTNPQMATYYTTKFEQGVIAATADANRSLVRTSLFISPRPLA